MGCFITFYGKEFGLLRYWSRDSEGYLESVNEKLTGWKTVKNTLYENQTLIDLLNIKQVMINM